MYAAQNADIKTNDITSHLTQALVDLCTCAFNTSLLVNSFIVCFDSPQYVTYRAVLTGTNTLSACELTVLIEQWIESDPLVVVQSEGLRVRDTCPVVIAALNSPECPGDLNNCTMTISSNEPVNAGAVAGGVVVGLLAVVSIVAVVIVVVVLKRRSSGSKDYTQHKTSKINSPSTE